MKLIRKYKSPNFNDRKGKKINYIIIHYTAIKSLSKSIEHLCSNKNKVSSHYLISNNGDIYNLVPESQRAWHAGQSRWKEYNDMNSVSIGIELDYFPSFKKKPFNKNLINSLISLLQKIINKYQISPENILAHSDIAPYRKIDPGNNFPWTLLENLSLSFKIQSVEDGSIIKLINKWFKSINLLSRKKRLLFMLNYIGYDVSLAIKSNINLNKLLINYQNRYQMFNNRKYEIKQIDQVIQLHFINIILTKLKK